MEAIAKTFKRYELKYILDSQILHALLEGLDGYMQLDEFGLHTITSICYDTVDYRLIRKSIGVKGKGYKEKLRLRAYGQPSEGDRVAIELKKKYEKIVYKRRIFAPLASCKAYLSGKITAEEILERAF